MLRRPGNFDVHRPRTPLECLRPYRNPPFTRLAETLRPGHRQPFAVQIQVHQREAGAQSMMVLLNPSVSHLLETEDALQNPKRMFHLRSHSGLYPVPGPFVTRPQSSCSGPSGWSYLALAEPLAGWLLPVPDTRRRPTPCAPPRAADPAAGACPPPKPPTCTPNAHGLAWNPLRCVPSARSTTAFPCASDAFPDRALRSGSWSTRAHE